MKKHLCEIRLAYTSTYQIRSDVHLRRPGHLLQGGRAAPTIPLHGAPMIPQQPFERGDEICGLTLHWIGYPGFGQALHLVDTERCFEARHMKSTMRNGM